MSKYPTITLGGFITHQEVIELAALLAQSDCYPAIMCSEGADFGTQPDPLAEDHMVVEFYRAAISESIKSELSFMFGFDSNAIYRGSEWTFINDILLPWGATRASRLLVRIYKPQESITLHGCGWGGQSVRLDSDDNPVIALPENTFRRTSGQPLDLEHVDVWRASKFLRKMYDAHLVWETPIPALICVRDEFFEQEQGAEYKPLPRRPDYPKMSLILE